MRNFLSLFFLFFIFFTFGHRVAAQTSTIEEAKKNNIDIPGVTRGVAGSPESSACCKKPDNSNPNEQLKERLPNPCLINVFSVHGFCLDIVTNPVVDFLTGIPVVNNILNLSRNTPINACVSGVPSADQTSPSCKCEDKPANSAILCQDFVKDQREFNSCMSCAGKGVWTGLGCIYTDVSGFVQNNVLGWGISLAGLLATLCVIYSAFMLQTSRGNPDRLKKAREYLTSCLIGLGLIIGSILILRIIGINILRVPGLF